MIQRSEHDHILDELTVMLELQRSPDVRVALPQCTQPDPILCPFTGIAHVPDLTATVLPEGFKAIFEVETDESLGTEHTASQLRLFDRHAKQNSIKLFLVVPQHSHAKAQQRVIDLELGATVVPMTC